MVHAYWLDPVHVGELLRAVLRGLAGSARVAVEGDAAALDALGLSTMSGARLGPTVPFTPQDGRPGGAMVTLPLDGVQQADMIADILTPGVWAAEEVGAVQIECHGKVEFMAADSFHRECVSVGPSVPVDLLRRLASQGVIRGFYTPSEARMHFQGDLEERL